MGLHEFAVDEFKKLNIDVENGKESDFDVWGAKCVLRLIDTFAEQGHSGLSASWTLEIFNKLASYKPLSELTSDPNEWFMYNDGEYQNKRCPAVFTTDSTFKTAYYLDGYIFVTKEGSRFTNINSRLYFNLPFKAEDLVTTTIVENSLEHSTYMADYGIDPFSDEYLGRKESSEDDEDSEPCVELECVSCSYDPVTDQVLDSEGYIHDTDSFIKSSLIEYTKDNIHDEVNLQLHKVDNSTYKV